MSMIARSSSRHGAGALLLAALLCSCASSPAVEFYALEPVTVAPAAAFWSRPLQVARVHLPPSLDRRQMVRQTGAYRLDISDRHRWSAPLDQMIQRSLSEDLLEVLPAGRVVPPQEPAPKHTLKLVVDILRFMPDSAGRVSLEASWTAVSDGRAEAHRSALTRISVPMASMSYSDQVAAMSEALARLASQIARDPG